MNSENNVLVRIAVENLKVIDPDYFERTLTKHLSGGAGSIVSGVHTVDDFEELIYNSNWEEYSHPTVANGCYAFKSNISGYLGIVDLSEVPSDFEGFLDDRKKTGKASFCIEGIKRIPVDFTVIIIGTESHNGLDTDIMYTIHPGQPIKPSSVDSRMCYYYKDVEPFPILDGKKITVSEAIALGIEYGNIV